MSDFRTGSGHQHAAGDCMLETARQSTIGYRPIRLTRVVLPKYQWLVYCWPIEPRSKRIIYVDIHIYTFVIHSLRHVVLHARIVLGSSQFKIYQLYFSCDPALLYTYSFAVIACCPANPFILPQKMYPFEFPGYIKILRERYYSS